MFEMFGTMFQEKSIKKPIIFWLHHFSGRFLSKMHLNLNKELSFFLKLDKYLYPLTRDWEIPSDVCESQVFVYIKLWVLVGLA